jgi:hypothetical protein
MSQISEVLLYPLLQKFKVKINPLNSDSMSEINLMEQNHSAPLTKYKFLTSVMSTERLVHKDVTGDIHMPSRPNYHKNRLQHVELAAND